MKEPIVAIVRTLLHPFAALTSGLLEPVGSKERVWECEYVMHDAQWLIPKGSRNTRQIENIERCLFLNFRTHDLYTYVRMLRVWLFV